MTREPASLKALNRLIQGVEAFRDFVSDLRRIRKLAEENSLAA